ncbi:hypothetical protein [Nicoliella lavandulae]|uniref:Uncharacterized protein n=1 Tax=Nicoliella lavandulae TaxID=3082954 RepID=A0ABU8SMQ7_9LACO
MDKKDKYTPKSARLIITLIVLIIELLLVMPAIITKMADALNASKASTTGIWVLVDLAIINLIWFITWLCTYYFANDYFIDVLKTRNVRMVLLILGVIFTLETVVNNNHALVAVFSLIAYLSLWAWFDYVFAHPDESDHVIKRTNQFVQNHRPVSRKDVEGMIDAKIKSFSSDNKSSSKSDSQTKNDAKQ